MTRSLYGPKSFKTQSKAKHVSAVVKLIPSLFIGLRPHGGICGLRGAGEGEKAEKESFVNRKEASNRKDIYKAAFGYRSVWKGFFYNGNI